MKKLICLLGLVALTCAGCEAKVLTDDPDFVDAQGQTCRDWDEYVCECAAESYGYSKLQQRELLKRCAKSCKLCGPPDETNE